MIKPIRTAADLRYAKAHIRKLISANGVGDHDDEIEVLSTLIEQFEGTRVCIDAPSPITAIKFRMAEMGLSPRQLEPYIGSRARVSEVLSGKRQLSIDMIRSLHKGLKIPYESLISKRSQDSVIDHLSAPAMDRLKALGFEIGAEAVPSFLEVLLHTNSHPGLHRKTRTQRAASKMDQTALLLWQAAVVKKAESQSILEKFKPSAFGAQALRFIARLSTRSDGPLRAVRNLMEHGVSVVIFPPLPGTFLDGAAIIGPTGNPIIGLTLRHDRIDSFWFTLLHEAAHVALHYDQLLDGGGAFVDDMEIHGGDVFEREADEMAQESLIPSSMLSQINWDENTTQDEITAIAIRARIHVAIAAGRWQRDHQNYKKFSRLIERGTVREMFEVTA